MLWSRFAAFFNHLSWDESGRGGRGEEGPVLKIDRLLKHISLILPDSYQNSG